MLARLGHVCGWIGSGLAVLLLILGGILRLSVSGPDGWVYAAFFVVSAALSYGAGRALRYIFAGD
jgi:hypothetical protein